MPGPGPEERPRPRELELPLYPPDLRLFLIMSSRDMSSLLAIFSNECVCVFELGDWGFRVLATLRERERERGFGCFWLFAERSGEVLVTFP